MGFSDEDIRASHTIRIFGTNEAGELLPDIWLDIERIDIFRITTQHDGHFQGLYRRLYWMDDPVASDYAEDGNPARTLGLKKFCSPDEEDQENPAEWVPVRTIIEMAFNESTDYQQRGGRRGNRTSADNQVRIVEARRCFHRETTIDDAAQAAADEGQKAFVVPSNDYDFVADSADKSDYIEVQYVSSTLAQSSAKEDEGKNQMVQTNWKNVHYLNFTDPAEGPANPNHGFDPPWSLDPFQAVVNVQFSPLQDAVLGLASPASNLAESITKTSGDGLIWDDGFGISSNAATGLGYTVVCSSDKYVVFGKPRNGAACFITAKGNRIERGVLNAAGDMMVWTVVATLPDPGIYGVQSCSFAGGAFFVSYLTDAKWRTESYLAVSFDGENFTKGVKPFNGVVAAANGTGTDPGENDPNPVGGSVAYDAKNKRYVTTGKYLRAYWNQQDIGAGDTAPALFVDENFMSAVSSNGTSWTAQFDNSECSGFPPTASAGTGGDRNAKPSVTFGNGKFIASSSFKLNYPLYSAPSFAPYVLTAYAAAVATSSNGTSWINRRLPGSRSTGWVFGEPTSSSGGYGSGVKFFKGKKNDSGVPGFFVATAAEYGGADGGGGKVWQSEDGARWALVRTDTGKADWILSAINKGRGTVVYRD